MESEVVAALVTSVCGLGLAVVSLVATRRADAARRAHESAQAEIDRRHAGALSSAQRAHEEKLTALEARLADLSKERDARIDYEYQARKNLYATVGPLSFQLGELAQAAASRITSLARTARDGNLGPAKRSWLGSDGYFYRNTLYRLLAPLALGELIRRQLTTVDIGLDDDLATQYRLLRQLTTSFSDDHRLARAEPTIPYRPDQSKSGHGDELGNDPALRRQGIYTGWLEQARDALICRDGQDPPRVMNFGEFEALCDTPGSAAHTAAIHRLRYLMHGFHPGNHPVLWRVLIVQLFLYRTFIDLREGKLGRGQHGSPSIRPLAARELEQLDWRSDVPASATASEVVEPVAIALRYLSEVLPHLVAADAAPAVAPARSGALSRGSSAP